MKSLSGNGLGGSFFFLGIGLLVWVEGMEKLVFGEEVMVDVEE